jgi:hypothetical protein
MTRLDRAGVENRLREAVSLRQAVAQMPAMPVHRNASARMTEPALAIRHIAEALSWFEWLDDEDAALVQARLEGARWKLICWRFGISRATAYRRWRHALRLIAWRLNGNALPTGCSRRHFMRLATARV